MHDRAQFWSPVPDWTHASLHAPGIDVVVVNPAGLWLVSGDTRQHLARFGVTEVLGPRQASASGTYALRIAPDRTLLVAGASAPASWPASDGGAVTDISDGMLIFAIRGEGAGELMAQGNEYPFDTATILPHESAMMQFAGFRLAVARRTHGWRLHIERPCAAALWRWLQAQVEPKYSTGTPDA